MKKQVFILFLFSLFVLLQSAAVQAEIQIRNDTGHPLRIYCYKMDVILHETYRIEEGKQIAVDFGEPGFGKLEAMSEKLSGLCVKTFDPLDYKNHAVIRFYRDFDGYLRAELFLPSPEKNPAAP